MPKGKNMRRNRAAKLGRNVVIVLCAAISLGLTACRSKPQAQHKDFFTSGSKEADQRASQRMAKAEQLEGSGEGSGEKGVKKATKNAGGTTDGAQAEHKLSLFERLGGDKGLTALVNDF